MPVCADHVLRWDVSEDAVDCGMLVPDVVNAATGCVRAPTDLGQHRNKRSRLCPIPPKPSVHNVVWTADLDDGFAAPRRSLIHVDDT